MWSVGQIKLDYTTGNIRMGLIGGFRVVWKFGLLFWFGLEGNGLGFVKSIQEWE